MKAEDNEEEEEFIPKRTHRYEMRDRKKNSSMNFFKSLSDSINYENFDRPFSETNKIVEIIKML